MIDLRLVRQSFTEKATEGELFLDGRNECWTLEDRDRHDAPKVYGETAIPVGHYRLELYNSPKHGPDTLQLVGVPGFSNVQIHAANKAEELLGCIAVGNDRTRPDDDWIGGSRLALGVLRAKIIPRMRGGEEAWITITREGEIA